MVEKRKLSREEKREIIVSWLATPNQLRKQKTAYKLAVDVLGYEPGNDWYNILKDPQTIATALKAIGIAGLSEVPEIMGSLAEAAKGGSVRAADSFLKHTIDLVKLTDAKVESQTVAKALENTALAAEKLLKLADNLQKGRNIVPIEGSYVEAEVEADLILLDTPPPGGGSDPAPDPPSPSP